MPAGPLQSPRPWVAEDLDDMPDDGYRREVIDGVLIVSPAPNLRHQICLLDLAVRLNAAAPDDVTVLVAPYDWRPPTRESLQPDVVVIRRADGDPDGPLRATPLLVVEVLSPSSIQYDNAVKRAAYERLGALAYWIVDPVAPGITVLRLSDRGRYQEVARGFGDQRLSLDFPFPLPLTPTDLIRKAERV
jgi:Uma2 family endonuclease